MGISEIVQSYSSSYNYYVWENKLLLADSTH